MSTEPEPSKTQLLQHLERKKIILTAHVTSTIPWTIKHSKLGGRGVFALRDFRQGELIYKDAPLLIGPRRQTEAMCAVCHGSGRALFSCDKGCGLPVCSNKCENSVQHELLECQYLREKEPIMDTKKDWLLDLLKTLVPVRALALTPDEKKLLRIFQGHEGPRHELEVRILRDNIQKMPTEEEEEIMRLVCRIFDTNSFATAKGLRALYPIGAFQNHCCVPNTRHRFDEDSNLYVYAALPIKAGEEITMAYTDLLWDTTLRRDYLAVTKHFLCHCHRCSDPTECGSFIGSLRCAYFECHGVLYPTAPPAFETNWHCNVCCLLVSSRQIKAIRSGLSVLVTEVLQSGPRNTLHFAKTEMDILVPETSYVVMNVKFHVVSYYGRTEGLLWKDLKDSELRIKKKYCKDLLRTLETLESGDSTLKGLILNELYCVNVEMSRRKLAEVTSEEPPDFEKTKDETGKQETEELEEDEDDNSSILNKATEILQEDFKMPE